MIALTMIEREELWHLCKNAIESNAIPEGVDADEIGKACLKLEIVSNADMDALIDERRSQELHEGQASTGKGHSEKLLHIPLGNKPLHFMKGLFPRDRK